MAEDDIWASDEDNDQVSYDQMIAQREWEKMNEVHGNVRTSPFQFHFGGSQRMKCASEMPYVFLSNLSFFNFFLKEGYKDGIVAGKDVTIQEGFNKGYKEGVALGRQLGKLRGVTR
jgi:Essential protein Yae1, N terminal